MEGQVMNFTMTTIKDRKIPFNDAEAVKAWRDKQ
jgi:hypothetical protein